MIAFQVRKSFPLIVGKHTKPVKAKDYFGFIHDLPCIITGSTPVEAAHVNFANRPMGAPGRGKGTKASDRWCLPLCKPMHDEQHDIGEEVFWRQHRINPHIACLVLWGLWSERGEDAVPIAQGLIRSKSFQKVKA